MRGHGREKASATGNGQRGKGRVRGLCAVGRPCVKRASCKWELGLSAWASSSTALKNSVDEGHVYTVSCQGALDLSGSSVS